MCCIFRAYMAYGFTPTVWRQIKVTFIPKPGKLDYTEAKAYRPISLSSFLLKTMEKLMNRHIRDGALKENPLHRNQRANQTGKYTETAVHNVVTSMENASEHKYIALGAFLNIQGAFDRTSIYIIQQPAERRGIEPPVWRWICAMLQSRNISATLSGETLGATAARGCLQGGVLSPLLWSLVMDDLLWGLNNNGYYKVGYADDIAILINGKFPHTLSEVLQTALCTVQQWCERIKLPISPNKTVVIPFTRKWNIKGLSELIVSVKESSCAVKSSTLE
jgi:hypothetical protein